MAAPVIGHTHVDTMATGDTYVAPAKPSLGQRIKNKFRRHKNNEYEQETVTYGPGGEVIKDQYRH